MKGISRENLTLSEFTISVEGVTGGISEDQGRLFGERIEIVESAAREIGKSIGEGPLHVGMALLGIETIGVRSWDDEGVREPKKGVAISDKIPFHKMLRYLD